MLRTHSIPAWKTAPFLRLLAPLVAGILLQHYLQWRIEALICSIICFTTSFFLFLLLPLAVRFKIQPLQGLILQLMLLCTGSFIKQHNDIRQDQNWYGHFYHDSDYLVIRINEPPVEKAKTVKAEGYAESVVHGNSARPCRGKLLLYFSKDSGYNHLDYGDRILIRKRLQPIKNSGNPGAFNYVQYSAFHQTFHQVFLKTADWEMLPGKKMNPVKQFLFASRKNILSALRNNMHSARDELGIAEALLIGYTNDLDRDLVQAYSNTGVVHIIAISGMHLALIYMMLVWVFARLPLIKRSRILQVSLILGCLWLFSLLTGGSASVLRSAVMFSFITIGKNFVRQASIYNALAASAFMLLCYDPYFLWDVGFQLSYLALTGIVVFQKPVYNLFFVKNKWADQVWQLAAVSLAAQVLTLPVCIYYFHQVPMMFLLANIITVPLSSVILYTEIFLLAFSWIPLLGSWLGKITAWLVWLMNEVVVRINQLPFAVWEGISLSLLSTCLMYMLVIGFYAWLMNRHKPYLFFTLTCLLFFTVEFAFKKGQIYHQRLVIIYNIPKHMAIDFVDGRQFRFLCDFDPATEPLIRNFHLDPARTSYQLNHPEEKMSSLFSKGIFYQFCNKKIVILNKETSFEPIRHKIDVDLIIISGNPRIKIPDLDRIFNCKRYVFDASNSLWKIGKWKADCSALHLQCHSVPEEGAFVLEL